MWPMVWRTTDKKKTDYGQGDQTGGYCSNPSSKSGELN